MLKLCLRLLQIFRENEAALEKYDGQLITFKNGDEVFCPSEVENFKYLCMQPKGFLASERGLI